MFALPYYRFTVTQFIKGQELPDKEHLVCGTWTGDLAYCPCSLLQGPMCQHLPLEPALPLVFLWRGPLCCSSPHRGPSKPRRSITSHPSSSSKTPLVGPSTPFTLRPPFHAPVLTVDQLEGCNRPPLQHTARGITIKVLPLCKRFKPCIKLESAHTLAHIQPLSHWHRHTNTHTLMCHVTFEGFWVFLSFLPCIASPTRIRTTSSYCFFECLYMYTYLCVCSANESQVSYSQWQQSRQMRQKTNQKTRKAIRKQRILWNHSLFSQSIKHTLHAPFPSVSSLPLTSTKSLYESEIC